MSGVKRDRDAAEDLISRAIVDDLISNYPALCLNANAAELGLSGTDRDEPEGMVRGVCVDDNISHNTVLFNVYESEHGLPGTDRDGP